MPEPAKTSLFVNVKKPGENAGRPSGKRSYVVMFKWEDVKTFEVSPENGVEVTGFEFLPEKKPIAVYATPSSIKIYDNLEGEDDARGRLHHVEFSSPGNSKEIDIAREHLSNLNLGAITMSCGSEDCKLAGSPCAPLNMDKDEGQDDKEACKSNFSFSSSIRSGIIKRIKKELILQTGDPEIDAFLGLTKTTEV